MLGFALRGLAAGAAGTTALNAATYADMAIRGRGASSMPETAVEKIAGQAGYTIPGEGEERQNRLSGLGALSGIATGTAAGIAASMLGPVTRRLPLPIAAALVGGMAMAGSDVPLTQLGLTDPAKWSSADWLSDALPHLAFGAAAVWTLRALGKSRA